jgi:uncharacterized protein YwqG
MDDAESEAFSEVLTEHELENHPSHLFGGHAEPLQNPMELQCAAISAGIDPGQYLQLDASSIAQLTPQAADWRLLLQLESDELAETSWGADGRLYYWMHHDALRRLAFDRAWCILQTT